MKGLNLRVEPNLAKVIRRLGKLPAPELAFAAGNLIVELEGAVLLVSEMRAIAIQFMRADGLSYAEIADLLGISANQARLCAENVVRDLPRHEAAPNN